MASFHRSHSRSHSEPQAFVTNTAITLYDFNRRILFCLNTLLKQNMIILIYTHKNDKFFGSLSGSALGSTLKQVHRETSVFITQESLQRVCVDGSAHRTGEPGCLGFHYKSCRSLTVSLGRDNLFVHLFCHL